MVIILLQTYNWNCGRGFYDTEGCDGASEIAVNEMPDNVEMLYSDIGDELYTGLAICFKHKFNLHTAKTN